VGEGKEVSLDENCPRSKLQQQCIKYLGPVSRGKKGNIILNEILIEMIIYCLYDLFHRKKERPMK
jgi:hypothetical protein